MKKESSQGKKRLALTTVGRINDLLLKDLPPMLDDAFEANTSIIDAIPLPERACDTSRKQYRSTALLDALARQKSSQWERLLGVTDVDLYTPDLNFVFGEADGRRGVAVFSLARLHTVDYKQFLHRAATEAIHEVAHTYGLGHCDDAHCVMWFSNTLSETDRKGKIFCPRHAEALRHAMKRSG